MKLFINTLIVLLFIPLICYPKIIPLDLYTLDGRTFFKYFVINNTNKIISNYQKSDFSVIENSLKINSFEFEPIQNTTAANSNIIILFDLSLGNINPTNKLIALEIIDTLLKSLPYHSTSIIGFDFQNYLFCNFTTDTEKLFSSFKFLKKFKSSGSDIDTAFFSENLGAFHFNENFSLPTNILLFTDKVRDFNYELLKSNLARAKINIFFFLINYIAPRELKEFSRETGCYIFEISDIKNVSDKIDILNFLFLEGKPSQIYWNNLPLCSENREIEIIYQNSDTTSFDIKVEPLNTPQLLAIPPFLRFSSVIPNQFKDLDLFLVAKNFDIRIDSFKLTDPHFKIINGAITNPIVLAKDSTHKLTIRFTPTDSSIVFDSLVIYSNACHTNKVNITGGFPNKKPKEKTLSVFSPKPDEKYFLGDTIKIHWDGVLPTDVVQLQYSTNGGEAWDTLAINVLGLEYKFYLDPQRIKTSDSCLVRVIQIWPNNAGETIELRHRSSINSANFNRDASLIVTSTNEPGDFVSIWNPGIGAKTYSLKGHTKQVNWACFDLQDRYLITASDDSTSILYDIKTGDSLYTFKAHKSKVTSANFSPDGNYLLTTGTDGQCLVWNLNSKNIVQRISTGINPIYYANFTPDSNYIAYASYDGNIYLFDIKQLKVTKTFSTKFGNNHIHHFTIHLGNKKLAAASHLGLIFVFDYNPEDPSTTIYPSYVLAHDTISYPAINTVYFNSNGTWLITAGSDSRVLRWNPYTGELIDSIAIAEHSNAITSALFSFDDAMLLTSSWDSTAKIFNRTKLGLQIDTTDGFFSIIEPIILKSKIDFGNVYLKESKDTLISPVIVNLSKEKVFIRNIEIEGENAKEFKLLNKNEQTILMPGDTLKLLMNFSPIGIGLRTSKIVFHFSWGKVDVELNGTGTIRPLQIHPNLIDFGEVEVGEFKDTLLQFNIANQSSKNINLISIRNIGPDSLFFTIIDGAEGSLIPPKGYHPITIRFTPDTSGKRNILIELVADVDSSAQYMNVLGDGIFPKYDSISISIGNHFAKPGDLLEVPVKIDSKKFLNKNSEYRGISFDLTFNKTILEPLDKSFSSYVENDSRTLKVFVEKNLVEDSILTTLRFRVGLGNDTITPLQISNSYPLGKGKLVIQEKSGQLVLHGICKEGGIRLFEPDGILNFGNIYPNPTEGTTYLSFAIPEDGRTKIEVYDNTGSLVNCIMDEYLNKGTYTLEFDFRCFETGIYLLILRTPNNILTNILQVVK